MIAPYVVAASATAGLAVAATTSPALGGLIALGLGAVGLKVASTAARRARRTQPLQDPTHREVCRRAADLIETVGWSNMAPYGRAGSTDRGICAKAAIHEAAASVILAGGSIDPRLADDATEAFGQWLIDNRMMPAGVRLDHAPPAWNDAQFSVSRVIANFRLAAGDTPGHRRAPEQATPVRRSELERRAAYRRELEAMGVDISDLPPLPAPTVDADAVGVVARDVRR